MIFHPTSIQGAFIVRPEAHEDERGFFARVWCQREFLGYGLYPTLMQCSISLSNAKGTLRGMHHQTPPHEETKLVRCTAGAIYDVAIGLPSSPPTFRQWVVTELTAANRAMLYIPEGVAHDFQTLEDDVEVFYQMSNFCAPESARDVRFDDPAFGVPWPLPVTAIAPRERSWSSFELFATQ